MELPGQAVGIVTAMKADMHKSVSALEQRLGTDRLTAGMRVRVHGEHLIVGRDDAASDGERAGSDDRVRLTRLGPSTWGLSVKRHNGRWERTPFTGTIAELVDVIHTFMQHLVAT